MFLQFRSSALLLRDFLQFHHLSLVGMVDGVLNRQDGVEQVPVAPLPTPGDNLGPFCSDETALFQPQRVFAYRYRLRADSRGHTENLLM